MKRNKLVKRFFIRIFGFFILIILCSCITKQKKVGSGIEGEVAKIDWSGYDDLVEQIRQLDASKERDLLMHKAEEMLLSKFAIIPYTSKSSVVLHRDNLHGLFLAIGTMPTFMNIDYEDGRNVANIQIGIGPNTLDPGKVGDIIEEIYYVYNSFGTLTQYDEEGNTTNLLLDHYTTDDGYTYKITIKDNMKWSDGVKITANDFVYALKRNAKPETGAFLSYLLNTISGYPDNLDVKVIDDRTYTIKFDFPCPYIEELFSSTIMTPLRQDIVENDNDWALKMPVVSSGPYYISEYKPKESLVFVKNPYYFDADNIKVDRINCMLSDDPVAVLTAYNAGDIDFAKTVYRDTVNDDIKFTTSATAAFLRFNVQNKFFEGFTEEEAIKFRKAIAYCVDREFYKAINKGRFEPVYVLCNDKIKDSTGKPFNTVGKYPFPFDNGYMPGYDIDKARQLLSEIGYHFDKKGKVIEDISIEMMATPVSYDTASILQADFEKLGINLKIKKYNADYLIIGDYLLTLDAWEPDYCDPLALLSIFESTDLNNYSYLGKELP